MYQSKENAGSIPWKSTRTGGGHGEGPRRPCVLEPTRSDSQFLHRSDYETGENGALQFRPSEMRGIEREHKGDDPKS